MDDVELATLTRELRRDCDVAAGALALARERFGHGTAAVMKVVHIISPGSTTSSNKWVNAWRSDSKT
jgi:hypothetical protein